MVMGLNRLCVTIDGRRDVPTGTIVMNSSSLAAVFHAPGEPLTIESYDLPKLGPGEVLVRVTCTTLCGSDVHTYLGRRSTPTPTILGHEIIGIVERLDPSQPVRDFAGNPLQVGDRVTWSIAASCGNCFYCDRDVPQKCEDLFKYGHEEIVTGHPLSGGLAEHCHLAAGTTVIRLPDELSDAVACPANCATATVAAALRVGDIGRGQTVLIQGAGMLGLTAAAMARSRGAREVLICDIQANRLERASDFGATRTFAISDNEQDLIEEVRNVTDGRGVDVVIELSGARSAVIAGLQLPRIGGRYVLIGSTFPSRPVEMDPENVVRRCLTIVGNHNYRPDDLATAIDFLSEYGDQFPFFDLVHDDFWRPDAAAAFERAIQGADLRVAVRPEA